MKKVIIALFALFFVPIGNALAVPIPFATGIAGVSGTIDDNLEFFTLALSGGAVTANAQTPAPIPLGPNWPFQLTITLNDTGQDFVVLSGNVFHDTEPHPPEGNGAPNNFAFLIQAVAIDTVTFNGNTKNVTNAIDLAHLNHFDHYVGTAQEVSVGDKIISWSATFTGNHIPEPSTIILLGSGLVGLLGLGKKRAFVTG
jgi:hypothetical protein